MPRNTKARTVQVRIERKIMEYSYVQVDLKDGQSDDDAINEVRGMDLYDLEFNRGHVLGVDFEVV